MTFESSEFDELFIDTVTYEPWLSGDGYGARTYGPPQSVKARIEQFSKLVTNQEGREVVSNTRVFMKPTAVDGSTYTPTVKDRITLPFGYAAPLAPPIISVHRVNDDQSLCYFEVSL